uniref:Uncharacterized protein n=1 Tax=Solanum lycopersicum TaxID=4081 RepID=A0A3Q7GZR6_SOLLC
MVRPSFFKVGLTWVSFNFTFQTPAPSPRGKNKKENINRKSLVNGVLSNPNERVIGTFMELKRPSNNNIHLCYGCVHCCSNWKDILVKKEVWGMWGVGRAQLLISDPYLKDNPRNHLLIEGKVLTCHDLFNIPNVLRTKHEFANPLYMLMGSTSLEMSCCNATIANDAASIGSTASWGCAACPPFPSIFASKKQTAAKRGPGLVPMPPSDNYRLTSDQRVWFKTECSDGYMQDEAYVVIHKEIQEMVSRSLKEEFRESNYPSNCEASRSLKRRKQLSSTKKHRRMSIMSTSMHFAINFALMFPFNKFLRASISARKATTGGEPLPIRATIPVLAKGKLKQKSNKSTKLGENVNILPVDFADVDFHLIVVYND